MRILYVFPGTTPDIVPWAQDFIAGLGQRLIDRGHDVHVVATTRGQQMLRDERANGPEYIGTVPVRHFGVDRWLELQPLPILRRFSRSSALATELMRSTPGFDIVHIHFVFPFSSLAAASACHAADVPYVLSANGSLDPFLHARHRHLKDAYLRLFGRRALNRASAMHFMSEGERERAAPFAVSAPQVVINYGIDTAKYRPGSRSGSVRTRYALGEKKVVLYVGRIAQSKGLDLLVDAFRDIWVQDKRLHLLLVGPDDGYGASIAHRVSRLGLNACVTLTGRVSEQEKLAAYREADVFAFPSYTEAFGLAMLEAMGSGLPVLTTDRVSLARDLVEANAALVVQLDTDSVAGGLAQLLNDSAHRQRLRSAARQLVTERFSWNAVAERFVDLYESVVTRRSPVATIANSVLNPSRSPANCKKVPGVDQ